MHPNSPIEINRTIVGSKILLNTSKHNTIWPVDTFDYRPVDHYETHPNLTEVNGNLSINLKGF